MSLTLSIVSLPVAWAGSLTGEEQPNFLNVEPEEPKSVQVFPNQLGCSSSTGTSQTAELSLQKDKGALREQGSLQPP